MKPILLCLSFFLFAGIASAESTVRTFAGTGTKGFSGDGGLTIRAQLNDPTGISLGRDGALYICDTANHRIRKVSADGKITTIAGTGEPGWSGDGGLATEAKLHSPYEVRTDAAGNLFWVERLSHTVRKCDVKTGIVSTIAGTGTAGFSEGAGIKAQLNDPHSIAFDSRGDLYIADVKNHRIRKLNMKSGRVSTFAGTGEKKTTTDGAPFATSPLHGPRALDFDKEGNLWLALREGNAIFKLDVAKGNDSPHRGHREKRFYWQWWPGERSHVKWSKRNQRCAQRKYLYCRYGEPRDSHD